MWLLSAEKGPFPHVDSSRGGPRGRLTVTIRQLKCDNQVPICANCKTYGQGCFYANNPAPAR